MKIMPKLKLGFQHVWRLSAILAVGAFVPHPLWSLKLSVPLSLYAIGLVLCQVRIAPDHSTAQNLFGWLLVSLVATPASWTVLMVVDSRFAVASYFATQIALPYLACGWVLICLGGILGIGFTRDWTEVGEGFVPESTLWLPVALSHVAVQLYVSAVLPR